MWNWRTLIRMVSYVENSKQNVCATWRSISFVHIRAFYFSCTYVRFWICTHYFLSKKEGQKHSNYFFCHYKTSYLRLYHCKKRPEEITSHPGKTQNRYRNKDSGIHRVLYESWDIFIKKLIPRYIAEVEAVVKTEIKIVHLIYDKYASGV